jgi:hypothetical protein
MMNPEEYGRKFARQKRASANGRATQTAEPATGAQSKSQRRVPPYIEFPLGTLPPLLGDYVDASAAAIGCDPALVALPALAVVASCIGNSCAIRLKRGWIEPSIIWAATIAPSGQLKTPGFAAAVDRLLSYQCDLSDEYQSQREQYDKDLLAWQDTPKDRRGPRPQKPERKPCHVTSDTTIEALGELLADNPRGVLLARDELDSWFQSFSRYKGRGGNSDRPQWLELHRAGTLRVDRLTRERGPLTVRRACCSVTGTIQPQVLARALDDEAMGAGLGARLLFAMPPGRRRVWTEAEVDDELAEGYARLLHALLKIPLADPQKRRPQEFTLAPEAKQHWVAWFPLWGDATDAAEGEQAAALAKLEGYAARLALVHHVITLTVAKPSALVLEPIGETSLRAALTLVNWFAGETARVYTILRETPEEREARKLVEFIEARGGSIFARDLQRANPRRWPSSTHAEVALDGLVQGGLGDWREYPCGSAGGRPSRVFCLRS